MSQPRQPFLHDLVTTFVAPTQVLSERTGQIGSGGVAVGAEGVLHADMRVLSAVELTVDGAAGEHIATQMLPAGLTAAPPWSSATCSAASRRIWPRPRTRRSGWIGSAGSGRARWPRP